MSRNIFGWDLPPGAAHDPYAPWNQSDDHDPRCPAHEDAPARCEECGSWFNCWTHYFRWVPGLLGAKWTRDLTRYWCFVDTEPECGCAELCEEADDE